MTSNRPYLLRAIYEWILDNEGIPHLLVDAKKKDVFVPQEFIEDGKIIFDLSPEAVRDLMIGNEVIEFRGRFGSRITPISIPVYAALALYNEEGIGITFDEMILAESGIDEIGALVPELSIPPEKRASMRNAKKRGGSEKQKSGTHKQKDKSFLKVVK